MRFFKKIVFAVFVILVALLCAIFYVQNQNFFSPEAQIKLDLYFISFESSPAKFYVLILISFFLGILIASLFSFIENFKLRRMVRKKTKEVYTLQEEINSLKGLPATGSITDTDDLVS